MNAQPPGRKVAKPRNRMPRRGQAPKPRPADEQQPPSPTPPEAVAAPQPTPEPAQPAPEPLPPPESKPQEAPAAPEPTPVEAPAEAPAPVAEAPEAQPAEAEPAPAPVEAPAPEAQPQPRADLPQPRPDAAPAEGQQPRQDRWENRRNRDRRNRDDRRDGRDNRRDEGRDNRRDENRDGRRDDRREGPRPPQPEMGPPTRGLTLLGAKTTVYTDQYTPALLEAFENRHQENDFFVKFNCPEFTSLCPITGQPDFATLYISYIPDRKMVESKSLKLYLFSFRNHGAFHEDCVNVILSDLVKLLAPRYIEVWGKFLPRGGLSIDPYANYGKPTTRWEEFARQRLLMHDLNPERVDNR